MSTTSRRKKRGKRAKLRAAPAHEGDGILCPFCKKRGAVYDGDRRYYCPSCKKLFDDDPDEGGDYSAYHASWRLERQEREKRHVNR